MRGLRRGEVCEVVQVTWLHFWPALKTHSGNGEQRDGGGLQVTSCHGERGTGLPWCSAGWEASSGIMAAVWELTGRGWVGRRIPAEDESNNSNMTLPKANLSLLRDDVSGFRQLTAASYGDTGVITLPYRTAWNQQVFFLVSVIPPVERPVSTVILYFHQFLLSAKTISLEWITN